MNLHIKKACRLVGGQTALAKGITQITGKKVTQQRVRNWLLRGDEVPADFMAAIETLTNKQVSRQAMRPEDWQVVWPELVDAQAANHLPIGDLAAQSCAGG